MLDAASKGHPDVVTYLIAKGADVKKRTRLSNATAFIENSDGSNGKDYIGIASILLANGADVNAQTSSGKTALHNAVRYGFEDQVTFLIENGADVNIADNYGETVMFKAAAGYRKLIPMLLENGAEIDIQDQQGNSPLMKAIRRHRVDMVLKMTFTQKTRFLLVESSFGILRLREIEG